MAGLDTTGQPVDFTKTTEGGISSTMSPYVTDLFENASALAQTPYQQYGAEQAAQAQQTTPFRVAGLSGLEQKALGGIGSLGAYNPIQYSSSYTPSQYTQQSFTTPGVQQQFMSPYQQGVTDIALREAQRQADIASSARGANAVNYGALGGTRRDILDAEAARNTAQLLNDIQTKGLQSAYTSGMGQFNTEAAQDFQRQYAQNMANLQGGQLGLQQQQLQNQANLQGYQSGLNVLGTQMQYGALPRALEQAGLDTAYQTFLAQQQKPYENLNFQKGIMSALPPAAYSAVTESQNYEPVNPAAAGINVLAQLGGLDFLKKAFG